MEITFRVFISLMVVYALMMAGLKHFERWKFTATAVFIGMVFVYLVWPALNLPFYWDTASFLIPGAEEFAQKGSLMGYMRFGSDYPHTPLLPIILSVSIKIFKQPIPWLHAQSMVWSIGMLAILYSLGKLLRNKSAGMAATMLLVTCPLYIAQTGLVYFEIPGMLFRYWALYCLFRRKYFWFTILALLGMAIRFDVGLIMISIGFIYPFLEIQKNDRWSWIIKYIFPLFLVLLGWFIYHRMIATWWFFSPNRYFQENHFQALWIALKYVLFYQGRWLITLVGLTIAGWSVRLKPGQIKKNLEHSKNKLIILGINLAGTLMMIWQLGYFLPRYALPVIVSYYLGFSLIWAEIYKRSKWFGTLLIFLICVTQLVYLKSSYAGNLEDSAAVFELIAAKKRAAQYIEANFPDKEIRAYYPQDSELTSPELGYVKSRLEHVRACNDDKCVDETDACVIYTVYQENTTKSLMVGDVVYEDLVSPKIRIKISTQGGCSEIYKNEKLSPAVLDRSVDNFRLFGDSH